MRTTLDIDDDVLKAAKTLARENRRTPGAVLSDLARKSLPRLLLARKPKRVMKPIGGFVPFASRGGVVTNEQLDRLREGDAY